MIWFIETNLDHKKPEHGPAVFTAGADEALIAAAVENTKAQLDKWNARWADGRAHVAGANKTKEDYNLLTMFTSIFENTHARNPSFGAAVLAHAHTLEHVMRVVNHIKAECQAEVDAVPQAWI